MTDSIFDSEEMRSFAQKYVLENQPKPKAEPENNQGIIGDTVDAFQKGAYQGLAGLAETSEQVLGVGEGVRDWASAGAKAQDETMSQAGRDALSKPIFQDDGTGGVEFGEGASDPRTWILNLSQVAGQYTDMLVPGTAFAKIGLKVGGKVVFKSAAKNAAAKGATKEQAEALGKKAVEEYMAKQAGTANVASFTAFGTAMAGGQAGIEVREEILELPDSVINESKAFSDAFYAMYDSNPTDDPKLIKEYRTKARILVADRAATAVQSDPMLIASNSLTELVGGKFLDGLVRGVGNGSRIAGASKGFATEGLTEAAQGGVEQYAQNKAVRDYGNPDQVLSEGVAANAMNEGVLGGVVGGIGGAARPGKASEENTQKMQPVDLNGSSDANDSGMSPINIDNSNFAQPSEQETEDLVAQLRQERQDFSGIDRDIRVAEKQGFEEQAIRLRAAKRNFEMAQDFMEEGDEQASIRFRERGLKIYKDVMGDNEANPSQQQEPTNQFPAEYTAEGELIETGSFPSTQVNQGEVYHQDADPMSMGSPAPQMTDQNVRDEIHIPAQDESQIAGNKNNGIDGPATSVGRASVMPSGVLDPNIIQYEAANEDSAQAGHGLELEPVDSIPYERPAMDNIIDRLAGNVQNEIDSYADKKRAQRMPEGLENDARVLREPFRQRLALTADQLKGKKRASSQVNPNEDSLLDAVAKLGGIDAREAISEGLDASDTVAINRAQFHKSFKARGGKSVDEMAESLSQYGFVSQDFTKNELLDKLRSAIAGNDVYSNFKNYDGEDYASWFKEAPQEVVGLGRQGVAIAINHALNGKKLGSKQAKAVKYVMDLESSERQERLETQIRPFRDRINSYRTLLKNPPKDMRDDPAVRVIEDRRADSGSLQQDTDAMAVIMVEAKELGISDNVIGKIIDKSNGDPIAAGLYLDEALNGNLAPLNNSSTIEQALGIKNDRSNEDPIDSGRVEQKQGALPEASGRNNGPEVQDVSSNGKRISDQVETEEPLLTSYTEDDLAKLNAEEVNKQQETEQAKIAEENKAQADKEADSFNLSGSDLPADKANSQGQSDLLANPTPAQKEAGNYKKKHIRMHGLEISIENQAGSVRSGTDEQGNEWSNEIHYDYGDIKGTTGADGDPIDVFVGKNLTGKKVFVVNQTHSDGKFDEHKVMFGFNTKAAAEAGYLKNYSEGWGNYSEVVETSVDGFKAWLKDGDHKKPFSEVEFNSHEDGTDTNNNSGKDGANATPENQKPAIWKLTSKKVWTAEDGQIITDESFTSGGVRVKNFFVYANHFNRDKGSNYASGNSLSEAKKKVLPLNDAKSKSMPEPNEKVVKLEDTGEILWGAKKHLTSLYKDGLEDTDISSQPLSKLWPKKEIESIENIKIAAFAHSARAEIPPKPRKSYKLARWVESVKLFIDAVKQVESADSLDGFNRILDKYKKSSTKMARFAEKVELLTMLDRSMWDQIDSVEINSDGVELIDGKYMPRPYINIRMNGRTKLFFHKTKLDEIIGEVRSSLNDTGKPKKEMKFEIRGRKGSVYINKKGDKAYRRLIEFTGEDATAQASAYIKNNADKLIELWEGVKAEQNVSKSDIRPKDSVPRTGKDHRKGKNISAESFAETFGFRGVQFGNWVKQGDGERDRQGFVNQAYDAFMDLADIIGVPEKALSLNGQLGIAFGARGRSRAMAHFEPSTFVINLTKNKGAGTLAHEWFHALDNYLQGLRNDDGQMDDPFLTAYPENYHFNGNYRVPSKMVKDNSARLRVGNWREVTGLREEVANSFKSLVDTLKKSAMHLRASKIDKAKAGSDYWSSIIEVAARSFENYVQTKMFSNGYNNDFLAAFTSEDNFTRSKDLYPYHLPSEMELIENAFDDVFSVLETKETDKGLALYKLDDDSPNNQLASMLAAINQSLDDPATERDFHLEHAKTVESWIADTEKELGIKVNVVPSVNQLPLMTMARLSKYGYLSAVKGVYEDGEMYLVANRIADEADAVKITLHEALGHHGVMGYLGKELEPTIKAIYKGLGRRAFDKFADPDYYDLDLNTEDGRRIAVLEYIAHAAETGKKLGMVKRFIAAMKQALRKVFPGSKLFQWSDIDVLALIDSARDSMGKDQIQNNSKGDTMARLQEPSKTSDKFSDLNSAQEAFLNKIGRPTIKQAAIHKIKEVTDNLRLKVRQGLVDRYAALMDLDKKLYGKDALAEENISSSAWVRAKMSNVASGAVSAMMNAGRIYLDPKDKVIDVGEGTNGLVHVLNKLGGSAEIERFMGWIAANRASKLMDEGRENLFTDDEIKAGAKLNKGKLADGRDRSSTYETVFEEFQQHRDDVLSIAEKAGIITSENKEMWSDEFYVPFYRIMEDMDEMKGPATMGGISRQQAYKKLKGGDQQLNDLLENTIMNFHHLIDASMKNIAAKQAIDNASALEVAQKVPESAKGKHSTFILENGQKVWYDIEDPLVFTAITSLAHTGFNGSAMKVMRGFKRIFTSFTTSSPQFMVANLIRDSLHSTAVSDINKNAFKNITGGLKTYLNDFEKARLNATGGSFNFGHLFGEDADAIKWQVDKEFRKSKLINKPSDIHHIFQAVWDKWQAGGNALENVNRASVFKQNEEKGKLYAAYQARDLMDFSAHGAWPAIRVLIDVVPFLNARLQGLDKMWRDGIKPSAKVIRNAMGMGDVSISERKAAKRFAAVAGTMALASVALYLHNQDDEEYQKLEDWQKDTYWFFRVGENGFFIPKPFEIGAMATLAERLTEQMVDDNVSGKVFTERLSHMLSDTFSFSPIPQAFQPVLDVYSNKDAFTGRDIETDGMERLSPSQRSRASTTNIAKGISRGLENTAGAVFGKDSSLVLSPVQIDHLIGAYLGWLGTSVTATADVVAKSALGETAPEKAWHEYQPIRRFYRDLGVPGYTRQQTEFYDQLKEVGQIYSDINNFRKLGDTESALSLMAENKDKLKKRLMLNKVQRQLQKINARMKVIQNSDRDGAWKRRELDRLKVMKERIVNMVSAYA